ncbi:hypothetical protein [Tissierella sp. Yu-01]|uniref:hypothetical protein n=1 Tax=Tissierella sp. Yu-01 TaxID=3035694 RepID=UPI00240E6A99|nr:hypothetical protein [Tissierella sp. Yu-01]WFA09515.1 hypothetical protein P3962_02890 [Tissierella sp. Yu-01]
MALFISLFGLLFSVIKEKYKLSLGMLSLSIVGVFCILFGIVFNPKVRLQVSGDADTRNEPTNIVEEISNETTNDEEISSNLSISDEDMTKADMSNNVEVLDIESSKNASPGIKAKEKLIVNEELVIEGSGPLEFTKKLVEIEMSKDIGIDEWSITENKITYNKDLFNQFNPSKPNGDMTTVRVEGNVNLTIQKYNLNENHWYSLDFYKMRGDNSWYIDKDRHYGVLKKLRVTAVPELFPNEWQKKNDSNKTFEEFINTYGDQTDKIPEYGEVDNVFRDDLPIIDQTDLIGAWHRSGADDFYMIFRDNYTYSYFDKRLPVVFYEGTYTVEQIDNYLVVEVVYNTDKNNSIIEIRDLNKNSFRGYDYGYSWESTRMDLKEAESILNSLR